MGHAVHYHDAAGESRLEDVPSLEAALELVERLRNEDGPTDVRVLRDVPVEVRTYYKVVALETDAATVRDEPPPGAMPLVPPAVTVHPDLEPETDADSNGSGAETRRQSLFSRG